MGRAYCAEVKVTLPNELVTGSEIIDVGNISGDEVAIVTFIDIGSSEAGESEKRDDSLDEMHFESWRGKEKVVVK
jgi:hypothetical protein